MILVGHGVEQVHAGLMLQRDVAFQFGQNLLLEFARGALAFEQVADKEQGQRAKTEEGRTESPLIANGMEEHQRVHEHGQPGRLNENEGSGENGELQLTPFETIQFFAVQRAHMVLSRIPDPAAATLFGFPPGSARAHETGCASGDSSMVRFAGAFFNGREVLCSGNVTVLL